jgi:hypothetical protein
MQSCAATCAVLTSHIFRLLIILRGMPALRQRDVLSREPADTMVAVEYPVGLNVANLCVRSLFSGIVYGWSATVLGMA